MIRHDGPSVQSDVRIMTLQVLPCGLREQTSLIEVHSSFPHVAEETFPVPGTDCDEVCPLPLSSRMRGPIPSLTLALAPSYGRFANRPFPQPLITPTPSTVHG